ncbi:hypothetical protein TVAG_460850 [Trichomonas vaginalis G3]|uniref:Ras-GAP domain-containing protein n=1 Tax=Trichomonas vaginalis (strain ATCC PRA-98 / G3) TaxID=412133 RepID=A2DY59_TRIV3|nr:GTPase activation domain, GAP family [Trichomonas vaginalis G3]EAY14668.1 hypothetical protein TVAG_460850 [Trichomonas vaginalis G3]KAI5505421.1 GTPase activation domain, GAP family [Trichomonas vaginalis G3]|eukprot:XP_001326891.1 hypothetical protein [Trichomonas vaginalis G3]
MFEYIYSIYGLSYHEVFIKKLADYILETNGYGINSKDVDLPSFERFINTIIKYIVSSVDEVPPVVKQMLAILRSYAAVRTNSCKELYDIVGSMFFESFIIPGLISYGSGTPENKSLMSKIVFILRVIFRLGKMNGKLQFLDALNLRLEKHIYPKLMEFVFTISENTNEDLTYEDVQPVKIARAIEIIMKVISARHEVFKKVYTQVADPTNEMSKTTILGAAVASLMTTFFLYQFDSKPPAEEDPENWDDPPKSPKKIKRLVKITDDTQIPEDEKLVHRIMRIDQMDIQTLDPNHTKKYYKRIVKKTKMGEK